MSAAKIAVIAALMLGVAAFFYFDGWSYLSFDYLKQNRDRLLDYAHANYASAVLIFIGVYIAQTAFSLPGGLILTLAGGFLFGSVLGTLFVNIGATAGATLAFLAARYVLRDWVERRFGGKLEAIQSGFEQNAASYLLTLRLIPLFPFFLVNLAAGITRVRVRVYVAATAAGIIPGSFVYAYAGRQLGSIDSPAEIASPRVLLAFVFLGVLALAPVAYKKFKARD
ncbi:MAG: TVP38/TMEM64 family protein [Gammaproteobacteria bacterium]|nr:TVP38/TMEM64 family protein [Gammaproteobacteria bacterium]